MTTVLDPPQEADSPIRVLHQVSWDTYQSMLKELENSSSPRLIYDRGVLEIMSPTAMHENVNRSIDLLVNLVALELGPTLLSLGSTTFTREDLARGFEPDSCFYIENEPRIRSKPRIDLSIDPVPDIVVEIDITGSTVNKEAIFAQFGVAEVWRYDGTTMNILMLTNGAYLPVDRSLALPVFTAEVLSKFVAESLELDRREWMNLVLEWARQQRAR